MAHPPEAVTGPWARTMIPSAIFSGWKAPCTDAPRRRGRRPALGGAQNAFDVIATAALGSALATILLSSCAAGTRLFRDAPEQERLPARAPAGPPVERDRAVR